MKMVANYFLFEGKRCLYVWKKSIVSLACVILAVVALVIAVYQVMLSNTIFPKIDVGVVVEEDDTRMELVLSYISAMESVEKICDFHFVTKEQGESMLLEDKLQVVMILPATLYEDLNSLENATATLLLPPEKELGNQMFEQILSSGVGLLHVAEAGVKASLEVSKGEELLMKRGKIGNFLAKRYAMQALDRMEAFEDSVISPMGQMSMSQYYFLAAFFCFSLVCGINFSFLYESKQKAFSQKLCIEGVNGVSQAFVKIIWMTLYLFMMELLLYIGGCILSKQTYSYFLEFRIGTVLGLLLISLAISVHFHLIYTWAKDAQQGALIVLITSILMVVCTGLILPASYLPGIAQVFGQYVPLYGWNVFAQSIFYSIETSVLGIYFWLLAELGIGVYISWKNV